MRNNLYIMLLSIVMTGCVSGGGSVGNVGVAKRNYSNQWLHADVPSVISGAKLGVETAMGSGGNLTVIKEYHSATGSWCRKYIHNGRQQIGCKYKGEWHAINSFSGR